MFKWCTKKYLKSENFTYMESVESIWNCLSTEFDAEGVIACIMNCVINCKCPIMVIFYVYINIASTVIEKKQENLQSYRHKGLIEFLI